MSRRRARDFDNVAYSRIRERNDEFIDAQFSRPLQKIPWKALSLAAILSICGLTMLILGGLLVSGHIDAKYSDRMWPLIILGALMFIPGAYHVRIAYYAFKHTPGYNFSDIPGFEM